MHIPTVVEDVMPKYEGRFIAEARTVEEGTASLKFLKNIIG